MFNYMAAPMGFTNSGHAFMNALTILLADLPVICEVDDCLLEGSDEDEDIEIFIMFLDRCRKYNIKICRRKIQCGPVVDFARMTLGGEQGF